MSTIESPIEIVLAKNHMVFLLYNLFGHDIIHDAHPGTLGSERILGALTSSAGTSGAKVTSSHIGGATPEEEEEAKNDFLKYYDDMKLLKNNEENKNLTDFEFLEMKETEEEKETEEDISFLEKNKTINNKSKTDIIESVGTELIIKKMLFGTQSRTRSGSKNFQNKTFIIIDLKTIEENYTKLKTKADYSKEAVLYPGNIYFDGKVVPASDIKVNQDGGDRNNPIYKVEWDDYSLVFRSNRAENTTKTVFVCDQLTLTNADNTETTYYLICPEGKKAKSELTICQLFRNYVTNLGNDFFYGAFTDYMRNETYHITSGYDNDFVNYVLDRHKTIKNIKEFLKFFQKIDHVEIQENSDQKIVITTKNPTLDNVFTAKIIKDNIQNFYEVFKNFYEYFQTMYGTFRGKTIPNIESGWWTKTLNTENLKKEETELQNEYIGVLAQIIGSMFNKYLIHNKTPFDELDKTELANRLIGCKIYQNKIIPLLDVSSCDKKLRLVQDFFSTCKFYMDLDILADETMIKKIEKQQTIVTSGGKKNKIYKQLGGDYIVSIMSEQQKDNLLEYISATTPDTGVNSLIPGKWDAFIKDTIVNYTGLNSTEINNYIGGISTAPTVATGKSAPVPLRGAAVGPPPLTDFYYENILNLIFDLPEIPAQQIAVLKEIEDIKFSLFTVEYFLDSLKYMLDINEIINNKKKTPFKLSELVMPDGNLIIMPIFTAAAGNDDELNLEISKQKKINDKDKNKAFLAIKNMYNFEQAFIVQLKVFLLYGYTKRIQNPGITKANKGAKDEANAEEKKLSDLLTDKQRNDFLTSFKKNLTNYLKIYTGMNIYAAINGKVKKIIKFGEYSALQKINSGYIVSSSISVMSYCLNKIVVTPGEELLAKQIQILNDICLKSNLVEASGASSIDSSLIDVFISFINKTSYSGTVKIFEEFVVDQLVTFSKNEYELGEKIEYLPTGPDEFKDEPATISMVYTSPGTSPGTKYYKIDYNGKNINNVLSDQLKDNKGGNPPAGGFIKGDKVKYKVENWLEGTIAKGPTSSGTTQNYTITVGKNNITVSQDNIKRIDKTKKPVWVKGKISAINTKKTIDNKQIKDVTDTENYEIEEIGTSGIIHKKKNREQIQLNIQDLIKDDKRPANINELYFVNNAVGFKGVPNYFCPYSSIMDGQSTCNSYNSVLTQEPPSKNHPIEEGTINVLIRDGPGAETMRYHIRVEKSTTDWSTDNKGKKIVNISAYLKINGNVLINIGNVGTYSVHTGNPNWVSENKPISVDLNSNNSPLEAKNCISEMMQVSVELLSFSSGTSLKKWDDYLKIINPPSAATVSEAVAAAEEAKLVDTKKGQISKQLFRRKIIEASFIKSLGDYLQEINTVASNGGYTKDWRSTNISDGTNNLSVAANTGLRLGLSNDRPSGVRIAFLLLFGLSGSGINPQAIGGYAPNSGNYVLVARESGTWKGGSSKQKYKIYNNVNNKVKNNTKRRKNITKKQKKLLKNRKISKRNNKGTRKRK